jgi:hypothetical protein
VSTTTLPDPAGSATRDADAIERLHDKLCRELAQSEHDAHLQSRREAQRQGPGLPSEILLEIADHAEQTEARLRAQITSGQPIGAALSLVAAKLFSNLRYYAFDRMIAHERSYRATLLGLRHGLDAAHLLRATAERAFRPQIQTLCAELIRIREPMFVRAVAALDWFADHADLAIR